MAAQQEYERGCVGSGNGDVCHEYVYRYAYADGDDVDGIYLIIEGDFEIYKKIDNGNNSYNLDKIEKKIEFLKKENNHLNKILNSNFCSKSSRNFKSQKQNSKPFRVSKNGVDTGIFTNINGNNQINLNQKTINISLEKKNVQINCED